MDIIPPRWQQENNRKPSIPAENFGASYSKTKGRKRTCTKFVADRRMNISRLLGLATMVSSCGAERVASLTLGVTSFRGGISLRPHRLANWLPKKTASDRSSAHANAVRRSHVVSSSAISEASEQVPLPILRRHVLAGTVASVLLSTASAVGPSAGFSAQAARSSSGKTVFVAGATGNTGKRVVNELLSRGFRVRAGVRDIVKAKQVLPTSEDVDFVLADVTEGAEKLSQVMEGVDAVIVATGFRPSITDPFASWKVDNLGTVALVDASAKAGVKRFVMVSSLLVNGAATGQILNPAYIVLNLLGLTLIAKLQAENYVRQSGIEYTIIRPGGLKNDPPSGNIVLAPEDTLTGGSVSRDSVAQLAVDSLLYPEASFKVVELIAQQEAPAKSVQDLLAAVPA